MEYDFQQIEKKWKAFWKENDTYRVSEDRDRPKCYVLDMFPYPSGAGLHVGHPLGYIASDIYARYKRLKGFRVLHPMGFDAFGLPAEQYAMETGAHPAETTEKNIRRYREQLENIGFSYDWSRAVNTSDPAYYRWTQWIFLQIFDSWYDRREERARPIAELISILEKQGNTHHPMPSNPEYQIDARRWKSFSDQEKRDFLMQYRLAYQDYADVWWCEALGTVLANDEVTNGVSERGGHPVIRKRMRQWFLRITEYADRLLEGLDQLEWSDAIKEMQRNWIGKSTGARVRFELHGYAESFIDVFTTRPETLFGVSFLVLAPEHPLVEKITAAGQKQAVDAYVQYARRRSDRERMAETKQITGAFTGAYALHPFTRARIPVWIADYVLAGYGTGAIMAVPCGDSRDHAFARHFDLPIINIFGNRYQGNEAYSGQEGTLENSRFLNGMSLDQAAEVAIRALEDADMGEAQTQYRLRDAGFSRQRYWGEPFPIIHINGQPYGIHESLLDSHPDLQQLPVTLPMVREYRPGPEGQGPLAHETSWINTPLGQRESSTMPGYAGSSWYFLRFMDPHNDKEFVCREASDFWNQVDVYVGGTEHAVGHMLYSRLWTKILYDLGHIGFQEPFRRLINQGMIQGVSQKVHRLIKTGVFVSRGIKQKLEDPQCQEEHIVFLREQNRFRAGESDLFEGQVPLQSLPADLSLVDNRGALDIPGFRAWRKDYEKAQFIGENGELIREQGLFLCEPEVEKMSKSKYNVINPDDIVSRYGADTFRLYEMFLGPIEMSKPWDTQGIEGVSRFLKKTWRLFYPGGEWALSQEEASETERRILHRTLQKIEIDMERFSFNTSVSSLMICVNELSALGCHKREILEPLVIALAPFAPHISEELWSRMGNRPSVHHASFPQVNPEWIKEKTKKYPIAINGKTREELEFSLDMEEEDLARALLAHERVQKWVQGKEPKKIIYVPGRMINIVL